MKTKKLLLLLATVMPFAAHAADEGLYVSGAAGANWAHGSSFDSSTINTDIDYDAGWGVLGSFGYAYGNGIRTEIEAGYRSSSIDSIGSTAANGDIKVWDFMVNALYDFNNSSNFTPYIGVGGGIVRINYDNASPVSTTSVNDTDVAPAAQGIIGVDYKASNNIGIFADYRYLHAFDPSFNTVSGVKVDNDYDDSAIMVGIRVSFGQSEPAKVAEVPPPPPPARPPVEKVQESEELPTYMVFFDWDRYDLTPEARDILSKAARDASRGKIIRIEVTGHADRSGPDKYNMKLSQKRADAVKGELEKMGVAGGEIVTFAKGESDPLVPTADGVREPQNRRVEIYYRTR